MFKSKQRQTAYELFIEKIYKKKKKKKNEISIDSVNTLIEYYKRYEFFILKNLHTRSLDIVFNKFLKFLEYYFSGKLYRLNKTEFANLIESILEHITQIKQKNSNIWLKNELVLRKISSTVCKFISLMRTPKENKANFNYIKNGLIPKINNGKYEIFITIYDRETVLKGFHDLI